jgi:hypothetical protein
MVHSDDPEALPTIEELGDGAGDDDDGDDTWGVSMG